MEGVSGKKSYIVKKEEGIPYIFISSPLFFKGEVCGAIRFVYKDIETFDVVRNSFFVVLAVAMMFIILGMFLFNAFAKKITTPLEELTYYSGEISKGNYDKKVNIKSGDEIEVLADTFNEMSENIKIYTNEIKKSYRNQKEFFDDISHEFRTPLTSIIGFSDVIPKLEEKGKIDESSRYIKKEGERLLDLVNEILAIAKNENESFQIKNEFINIKKIIEEVIGLLSNRINNYHIILEDNSIINFVYCDYNKTKQVFLNILDNAIKYSGCEVITISSEKFNDRYEVIIKDDGVGFDTTNPRSENSTGFGLKICKNIMKNQNGDFKIESKTYVGTICRVIFYKQNNIKITIVSAVLICLIISVYIFISYSENFDKVTIVERKDEALKSINISIPKKIVISTKFYRETVITSKLKIDEILESINSIMNSEHKNDDILEKDSSAYTVKGKIYYNNKVDEFTLNNMLKFNGKEFKASSYKINTLHRKLFNYFNTYEHIIDILNTDNSSVYLLSEGKEELINKNKLISKLKNLKSMTDIDKLNNTSIKDKKIYTLKIKMNKNIKNKTNNLIFIDVYENYIVVQFLADDNGKKIYMEGSIGEV